MVCRREVRRAVLSVVSFVVMLLVRSVRTTGVRGRKSLKTLGIIQKFLRKFVDISEKMRIILSCMNTQKKSFPADSGDLLPLSRQNVVVGAKQLRKALNKGCARRVYLARNADPALTEPLAALCQHHGVEYSWVRSMTDLGRACGIEVGAATATVVD